MLTELKYWYGASKNACKQFVRQSVYQTKKVYQLLPLNEGMKTAHRNFLRKFFPKLLSVAANAHTSRNRFTLPISPLLTEVPSPDFVDPSCLEEAKHLIIPRSENPLVSVIIPVYGKIQFTLHCLFSIARHLPKAPFEVIVIDDCSPDDSLQHIKAVQGLIIETNHVNLGFLKSCNKAANAAKGKYLYFLNNDTVVTEGWMDNLLQTFDDLPHTGLAGSKLMYPDGRLQEAGGIVFSDSVIINYGRYQHPGLPEFNYAREVDYCSGASIMVPKALFEELGGFDEMYTPAYCEDTDLALKIRQKGYRVIYQPLSVVIHHEGVSSGTDLSQGVKKYQVDNMKKFFERWQPVLEHYPKSTSAIDLSKDRRATKRVLVIDACTPTPNKDAGSVVAFNLMLLMREMGFQVTFIPEQSFLYLDDYTPALQRAGIEALYAPFDNQVVSHLTAIGSRYDLVLLSRPNIGYEYMDVVRTYCPKAKTIYLPADLHFLRLSREMAFSPSKEGCVTIEQVKKQELSAFTKADACLLHSSVEIDLLQALVPSAKLRLLPLIMNIKQQVNPYEARKDLVFVGGYQHLPNVDAVTYFVAEVMPLLRNSASGLRFHVVGSNAPAEFQKLACEDVIITGFVDNLTEYLNTMRLMVAPLRYGAGAKGKVASSMAAGLPVVASPIAVEGMALRNDEQVLVADSPEECASAILRLYHDQNLWNALSVNGLVFAETHWGKQAIWDRLESVLTELGIETEKARYPLSLY